MLRILIITGAVMASLAACQAAVVSAPEASSSAAEGASVSAASAEPSWDAKRRKAEAQALAAHPGVAERAGDVLTVRFAGKAVATFTNMDVNDCEGFDNCSVWQFADVLSLQTAPGKPQTFIHLQRFNGEVSEEVLVAADGTLRWGAEGFVPSADGRFLAAGQAEGLIGDGYLEIEDFAGGDRGTYADFNAECDVVGWTAARTVSVTCSRNEDTDYAIAGTVSEVAPGTWRLQETEVLKKPKDAKVELRTLTVKLGTPAPPMSAEDRKVYDRKIGYHRLAE